MIFGVDIASGSPNSRRPPSYSLVILDGDKQESHHMISRHKLIRLIREMQPEIVAMDNVHELASSRSELISLLRRFPPSTKLVQVTGGDRPEALTKLAKWHGMTFDRLNPLEEAEACARLAAKGIGQVLSAFEDRTWIKVSRRRSPGHGGWSQNRYSRKIHGAVKGLAREVESQLRTAGLEYTCRAVEGLGGYTRAEFVVDAPREKVHVSPGYYCDAQVKVQGIERPQLQFKPLAHRRGYIVVGLDPGTTTGIAALTLSGDLIDIISAREMSSSDVIEWIAARGKPLIVATDVFPTPGAVEKIKRTFNAVLYSPGSDVPAEEKIALAKEYGYKNDHERDSLAAAVSAYKKYKNKFMQVDKKVPPEIDPDEVKALVVKGYSIENAIAELTAKPVPETRSAPPPEAAVAPDVAALRGQNQQLAEQIKTLRSYVDELNAELAERNDALGRLEGRMDRMRDKAARDIKREAEIKIRDKEIERLRALLRSERKYTRRLKQDLSRRRKAEKIEEMKGYQRLKAVETFSKESILAAAERFGFEKGDVVLLENASGGGPNTADLLIENGILAVITDSDMSPAVREYFYEKGIPVFSSKDVTIHRADGVAFVKPEDIETARAKWQDKMKLRQAERKADWLEGMLREYRVERRKEERKKLRQT
jgi:predicted RNase H-like nuclease (RuvC/YqgF family)